MTDEQEKENLPKAFSALVIIVSSKTTFSCLQIASTLAYAITDDAKSTVHMQCRNCYGLLVLYA